MVDRLEQVYHNIPICVAIPAYNRPAELDALLASIMAQEAMPAEVLICEDASPQREAIREVAQSWLSAFATKGCNLRLIENQENLGYDGNIRNIIEMASQPWVMLMGDDDLLLPDCIARAYAFVEHHPNVPVTSRSFVMFRNEDLSILGVSQYPPGDHVYTRSNSSPAMLFRTCGFVGGLIIRRDWAVSRATDRYDGTLYYQIYLSACAFCEEGIGYIGHTIVGSRAGNPPQFGAAAKEKGIHIPGSYTPKGRAKMWASVLRIAREVGDHYHVDLYPAIRSELMVQQSFHIFEMTVGAQRSDLQELKIEFTRLGLMDHPLPQALYWINLLAGRHAKHFYALIRKWKRRRISSTADSLAKNLTDQLQAALKQGSRH